MTSLQGKTQLQQTGLNESRSFFLRADSKINILLGVWIVHTRCLDEESEYYIVRNIMILKGRGNERK